MNTCALIPSYNEAKTIGRIIRRLKARGFPVIVVDDGSTDDTYSVAIREGARAIRHSVNMGKGASLREGFRRILADGFDRALIMNGDNQHEVDDIDGFIKRMDDTGADMVIGNRMSDTVSMPMARKLTNRFMSWLISKICGRYVPDSQCGFRLIKRRVLEKADLRSSNFEIESELIISASRLGFKIESVPVRTVYQDERSSINPVLDTARFLAFLVRSFFRK